MTDYTNYTKKGLRQIHDVMEYCKAVKRWSDRQLSLTSGVNPMSVGRIRKAWKTYPYHQKFDDQSLAGVAEVLWLPMSELEDSVTRQALSPLLFTFEELRAIGESQVRVRLSADEPLSPFTEAIEAARRQRQHSYQELCEYCFIPVEAADRIRRLLEFGGWSLNAAQGTGDIVALGRYVAELTPDMSDIEKEAALMKAVGQLSQLQLESLKPRNGAMAH